MPNLCRKYRNNPKGGTASLRSRTCVKRNALFGARFKGLSLHLLYQKGNSDTYQNGLGYISDTYPNPYLPVTVPPLWLFILKIEIQRSCKCALRVAPCLIAQEGEEEDAWLKPEERVQLYQERIFAVLEMYSIKQCTSASADRGPRSTLLFVCCSLSTCLSLSLYFSQLLF